MVDEDNGTYHSELFKLFSTKYNKVFNINYNNKIHYLLLN